MVWFGPGRSLERRIRVTTTGVHTLWVRKFWNPQAFRWRVDDAPWNHITELALTDLRNLSGDAGRRVGWGNAGTLQLAAGEHTLRLEVPATETRTTAYDCFLLTPDPFQARGILKPGERLSLRRPGWFVFDPDPDPFHPSPIDLRALNEPHAGAEGFIRVRGEDFVHERTGAPARFWAVNVGMGFVGSDPSDLALFARSMARRGVNLVRVHGPIYATQGPRFGEVDTRRLAQLQRFTSLLRAEGIYTSLSIYFPLWVTPGPDNPAFPGYDGRQHPFGLPYFSEAFGTLYRAWWRALLTTPNPDTGLAFKEDPSIAFVEMVNEDSTLFWTFNPAEGPRSNIPEPQRAILERRFGDWLRARHSDLPSLEEIRSRLWGGLASSQDDLAAGRVGIRPLWEVFNRRTPRDQDTAAFLTDLMTRFHTETYHHLKTELGYQGLVYASNWKTASPRYLDPLDKHANGVADFYDRHGYFGGPHEGRNAAWNIENGQTYDDRCALLFHKADGKSEDFDNPVFDLIYNHRPSVITEINWPLPNRFRADMVPFAAAYGALQGTDALHWFAAGSPSWEALPGKFSIQTPVVLGQFPAAALIYRQGLVRTANRVVDLELSLNALLSLEGTPLPAPQNFDELRAADIPPGSPLPGLNVVDARAFLVGRVGVDIVTNRAPHSQVMDLSPYIDSRAQRIRSQTGELELDARLGLLTLLAPAAQGLSGFLGKAGPRELPGVGIQSGMDYGSILVVALDQQPLDRSRRLLIQIASEEQPHEWSTLPDSGRRTLRNRGTPPLWVRDFSGTIRLKRTDAAELRLTPLDYQGYPSGPTRPAGETITLAPETPYYVLETRP